MNTINATSATTTDTRTSGCPEWCMGHVENEGEGETFHSEDLQTLFQFTAGDACEGGRFQGLSIGRELSDTDGVAQVAVLIDSDASYTLTELREFAQQLRNAADAVNEYVAKMT